MLMTMIDTHSHLFLEEFADDLPEVMERARQAGVSHIFMPNIDSTTLQPMLDVCRRYEGYCFPMIGLHPTSVRAEDYEDELANIFITSQAFVVDEAPSNAVYKYEEDGYTIHIAKAIGEKCERCWKYRELGTDGSHPTLCAECAEALNEK